MKRTPSLTSLRLFLQVAKYRSFSETARINNISQPALSRTIRLLEEELNTRLFDRDSRNVALTSTGEALLPIVERLTADFDDAFSELAQTFAGMRGRVIVGALPSVAAGLLPAAIATFQQRHPQVEISLRDQLSGALYQQMQDRQIDLAVTTPPLSDAVVFRPLFDDDCVLVCPAGSDLDVATPIGWSVFADRPFIAMAPRSSVREITDIALARAGVTTRPLYECTQLSTVGGLIAAGLGITALPRSTLGLLQGGTITARPLIDPAVARTIGIGYLANRTLPPAAALFLAHLLSEAATGPTPS